MKTTLALSMLLAALPAVAGAAADKPGPMKDADPKLMAAKMTEHMTDHLAKAFSLAEDQKKKVQEILEQSMPQRMELEKKVHKLEWDTDEKIRAVLNDDQKEKFDQWRMMRAHAGIGPGMGHRAPPQPGAEGTEGAPAAPPPPGAPAQDGDSQ